MITSKWYFLNISENSILKSVKAETFTTNLSESYVTEFESVNSDTAIEFRLIYPNKLTFVYTWMGVMVQSPEYTTIILKN